MIYEENLVHDAQQGDRSAFDCLVERHRASLGAFVQSRLGEALRAEVEVEDVLQEVRSVDAKNS